ncbi:hypothetical protein GQ457_07G004350 [Hibiscus cannabinus]
MHVTDTVLGNCIWTSVSPNAFVDLLASVDPSVLVDPSISRGLPVPIDPPSVFGCALVTPARETMISSSEPTIGVDDQNFNRQSMHPVQYVNSVDRSRFERPILGSSFRPGKRARIVMRGNSGFALVPSSTSVARQNVSSGFTSLPICAYCEKRHGGECRKKSGVCFRCFCSDPC